MHAHTVPLKIVNEVVIQKTRLTVFRIPDKSILKKMKNEHIYTGYLKQASIYSRIPSEMPTVLTYIEGMVFFHRNH